MATTLDFENKKIINGSKEIVFNGTENWVANSTGTDGKSRFRYPLENYAVKIPEGENCVSSVYESVSADDVYLNKTGVAANDLNIFIYDEAYATLQEGETVDDLVDRFKAHLAELYEIGNPVTVRYLLATPTETPFTEEETASGNEYRVYSGGTEKVLGNDNAEYGANNTLTQNYIVVKE